MSTLAVFPESGTSTQQAPPEPHTARVPVPYETGAPEPTSWQETVLDLLAEGASVVDAMRHVGYSSAAFYKACKRHPEFRIAAGRARNDYRAQVAEEFHDAEAYARALVDSVMRDEVLPASLRLRAALAILNRKGGHWLPSSIPVDTSDTVDNVDTVDAMDTVDTVDNANIADNRHTMGGLDTANPGHTEDTMRDADTLDAVDMPSAADRAHPMDTVDTLDNPDALDAVDTVDSMDTADAVVIVDTGDTVDTADAVVVVDTVDSMDTVDTMDVPDLQAALCETVAATFQKPRRIVRDSGGAPCAAIGPYFASRSEFGHLLANLK